MKDQIMIILNYCSSFTCHIPLALFYSWISDGAQKFLAAGPLSTLSFSLVCLILTHFLVFQHFWGEDLYRNITYQQQQEDTNCI